MSPLVEQERMLLKIQHEQGHEASDNVDLLQADPNA